MTVILLSIFFRSFLFLVVSFADVQLRLLLARAVTILSFHIFLDLPQLMLSLSSQSYRLSYVLICFYGFLYNFIFFISLLGSLYYFCMGIIITSPPRTLLLLLSIVRLVKRIYSLTWSYGKTFQFQKVNTCGER